MDLALEVGNGEILFYLQMANASVADDPSLYVPQLGHELLSPTRQFSRRLSSIWTQLTVSRPLQTCATLERQSICFSTTGTTRIHRFDDWLHDHDPQTTCRRLKEGVLYRAARLGKSQLLVHPVLGRVLTEKWPSDNASVRDATRLREDLGVRTILDLRTECVSLFIL